MGVSGIRVLHTLPGRVRLGIDALKNDRHLAAEIEKRLSRIEGIRDVVASAVTGTLLVHYEPSASESPKFPAGLAEEVRRLIPGIEPEDLVRAWLSGNGTQRAAAELPARRFGEAIGSVNERVAAVTGGIDLRLLVPLSLFSLGLRSVLFEPLARPAWYDFLWFAFGTFVALNPAVLETSSRPLSPTAR